MRLSIQHCDQHFLVLVLLILTQSLEVYSRKFQRNCLAFSIPIPAECALGPVPSTSWHLPDTGPGQSRSWGTREHGPQSVEALENLCGCPGFIFPYPLLWEFYAPVPLGLCTCRSHLPAWLPPTHPSKLCFNITPPPGSLPRPISSLDGI